MQSGRVRLEASGNRAGREPSPGRPLGATIETVVPKGGPRLSGRRSRSAIAAAGRTDMRRLLKFLHTMGAVGLMGAMACLIVLLSLTPPPDSLAGYALMRGAMGAVATWIFLPSLALTLVAGLLAVALHPGFREAGWA